MKLKYRIAERLGYDLIRKEKNHGSLHSHLPNVLGKLAIDCVLDVGANTGQYGRLLRASGFRGRIVSFEPVRATFEELVRQAQGDAAWSCVHAALGRAEGRQTINVSAASKLSSFREPSAAGVRRLPARIAAAQREEVAVRRLDAVFAELPAPRPARVLLKMDTQGYDLEVFAGAEGCLPSVAALQSELAVERLYEGMPDYVEALSVYRRAGFELTGLFPIYRDGASLIVGEMDCVMARV